MFYIRMHGAHVRHTKPKSYTSKPVRIRDSRFLYDCTGKILVGFSHARVHMGFHILRRTSRTFLNLYMRNY